MEESHLDPEYGYTLTFDNVDKKTVVRLSSRDNQNKMHNMVQSYAAKDRIPVMHLDDVQPNTETIKAIPIEKYLPNEDDINCLR